MLVVAQHMAGEGWSGTGDGGTPPRRRGRPRSSGAEAAIIRAAARLLAERGVRRMSMEAVAVAARVSKATIYRRWPSKDALIQDLVAAAAATDEADPPAAAGDVRAELLAWVREGLEGQRRPLGGALRHLVRRAADDPALAASLRRRELRRHRERFAAVVERGVRAGQLQPDLDVGTLLDLVSGPILYRWLLEPGGPPGRDTEAQAVAIVDMLWPGISTAPSLRETGATYDETASPCS